CLDAHDGGPAHHRHGDGAVPGEPEPRARRGPGDEYRRGRGVPRGREIDQASCGRLTSVTATYSRPPYADGQVAVIVGIPRPAATVISGSRAAEMGYGTQRLGRRPSYSTITTRPPPSPPPPPPPAPPHPPPPPHPILRSTPT